jgi:hypothetical protein
MLNQFNGLAHVRFPGKGNEGWICVPHTLKMESESLAGTHETYADLVRLVERGIIGLYLIEYMSGELTGAVLFPVCRCRRLNSWRSKRGSHVKSLSANLTISYSLRLTEGSEPFVQTNTEPGRCDPGSGYERTLFARAELLLSVWLSLDGDVHLLGQHLRR